MKNDIFNFRRFGKYFISDARSCTADFGLSMMLFSIMGLIIYLLFGTIRLALDGAWISADGGFRSFTFIICMCTMVISMPVKCYGKITDRKEGASWLMVPASTLEKSLSMILMTTVFVPALTMGIYFIIDMVICRMDPSCGTPLFEMAKDLFKLLGNFSVTAGMEMADYPAISDFTRQLSCPWLYIDDFIMVCLTFLLGAIFFRSGKTVKTLLAIFISTMIISVAATPVMTHWFKAFAADLQMEGPENLNALFSSGIFRHAALIDTINDTLINLALLAGIFFRVKTLKH